MTTRERGVCSLLAAGVIALQIGVCSAFGWQAGFMVGGALLIALGWSVL